MVSHSHGGVSAWGYVVLVVETSLATPNQALMGVAVAVCNLLLKGACGVP